MTECGQKKNYIGMGLNILYQTISTEQNYTCMRLNVAISTNLSLCGQNECQVRK